MLHLNVERKINHFQIWFYILGGSICYWVCIGIIDFGDFSAHLKFLTENRYFLFRIFAKICRKRWVKTRFCGRFIKWRNRFNRGLGYSFLSVILYITNLDFWIAPKEGSLGSPSFVVVNLVITSCYFHNSEDGCNINALTFVNNTQFYLIIFSFMTYMKQRYILFKYMKIVKNN